MSRTCQVCHSDHAGSINVAARAPGANLRELARRWGVGYDSLWRHVQNHLPALPEGPPDGFAAPPGDPLIESVAAQYGLDYTAVWWHREHHLGDQP
jgi:cytochrome c5